MTSTLTRPPRSRPAPGRRHTVLEVAVVGDVPLIERGVASMLEPYADRVRVTDRVTDAVAVDVTLYDISASRGTGDHSLDDLLHDPVHGQVIAYSWQPPSALLEQAMTQGLAGYVDKSAPAKDLVWVIERVAAGERRVLRPGDEPGGPRLAGWSGREHGLSSRESEILSMITQGLTNEDICARAHLSINTVKTYIRSAYRKIDVTRRSQAVRWGIEHGLLHSRPGSR